MINNHLGKVNAVFWKKFSTFAIYYGSDAKNLSPYHACKTFRERDHDKNFVIDLRRWLKNFHFHEGANYFSFVREMKGGEDFNLVCKIIHIHEGAGNEWMAFVWDGTGAPPAYILQKLEDEMKHPLPLHLEPFPLPSDTLCSSFPAVGTVLRVIYQDLENDNLRLLKTGEWVKLVKLLGEVHAGLWRCVLTPFTKLRYTPKEDHRKLEWKSVRNASWHCPVDYHAAVTKSLLYFEGQRSGKLPKDKKLQRVQWRGDSALQDGADAGIDLVGGYYDAGDNLKLGFPMAFTITMLSWSTIEMVSQLQAKKELANTLLAIKWGTDYLIKAHPQPDVLYAKVGQSDSDHGCWQRPEDMTTARTSFKIDAQHPGSDLAADTAAAFAAASIAFKNSNSQYSSTLLMHAKQLFDFARDHPGLYQDSIPYARKSYSSSGYHDEMLWAAAWLHRATNEKPYLDYVEQAQDIGGTRYAFSWDDKYLGAQLLVAMLVLEGKVDNAGKWAEYRSHAEEFICLCIQKGSTNRKRTPGGLLSFAQWDNIQCVATATFATIVYSNYLAAKNASLSCAAGNANPFDVVAFVKSQVDYILGSNPKNMSYMVGYGANYPKRIHHRGASIISIKHDTTPVTCGGGYTLCNRNPPNPNVQDGAVVGPDKNDGFSDDRGNFQLGEPTTYNTGPLVGVFA